MMGKLRKSGMRNKQNFSKGGYTLALTNTYSNKVSKGKVSH